MKIAALVAAFGVSIPLAAAGPTGAPGPSQARAQRPPQVTTAPPDKVAEAYALFLLGHRAEEKDDEAGAMESAEAALKIDAANREANRVLGVVYAALSETPRDDAPRPRGGNTADENVTKAIHHIELALDRAAGEADPTVRATLARLYVRNSAYEKAIPLLNDLVNQEPGWQDGPMMLAEAYAGAGRIKDAISWLEARTPGDPRLLPALADFYERERRWADAAAAYSRALQRAPRNSLDLKSRYASALLNAGGKENIGKARDALTEVVSARTAPEARALYLLSQAHRRLGDFTQAEATARRVIAQNSKSPWGYYALAETLEERHQYQR